MNPLSLRRSRRGIRSAPVTVLSALLTVLLAQPVSAHEDQVIEYGSFLAGRRWAPDAPGEEDLSWMLEAHRVVFAGQFIVDSFLICGRQIWSRRRRRPRGARPVCFSTPGAATPVGGMGCGTGPRRGPSC